MQKRLNLMRIMRVHRAALENGWYSMPLSHFRAAAYQDLGDRIVLHSEGHIFNVVFFDGDSVTLRKVS